jgi:hypothetical protein
VFNEWFKSTPRGWGCRYGRVDLVKLYLERGADPVETDAEPWATRQAWAKGWGAPPHAAPELASVRRVLARTARV